MQRQCQVIAVLVFSILPAVVWSQSGSALRRYQDSLAFMEIHLGGATNGIKAAQDLQRRMNSLRVEMDPVELAAGCRHLDSLMAGNSGLAGILTGGEKELAKLAVLRAKIASSYNDLVRYDTSTARGKKQFAALMKKFRKDQDDFTTRAASLLVPIRSRLAQNIAEKDAEIAQLKADQAQTEKAITDLKWKIEMELLHERTVRQILDPPPATVTDLLRTYASLIEAAERDKLHDYDSLFHAVQRQANAFLQDTLQGRHRDDAILIPRGSAVTRSGSMYTSRGFIVSRLPILQPDLQAYLVTTGERGLSFVRTLRAVLDRPAEKAPPDTLARVAGRLGGRLLTDDERDFIEASGFASVEDRRMYGVLSNFYEMMLNDKYAYVCWDTLNRAPALLQEFEKRFEAVQDQRDEYALNAWRTGTVSNPKRFVVSFGGFAGGYMIQHTEAATTDHLQLPGFGLASGSLLAGYRYAIEGNDMDGERYGYVGIQFSYLSSFGKLIREIAKPKSVEWKGHGYEVTLVATLLRSFYLGVGMGHMEGEITTSRTTLGGGVEESTEQLGDLPGYYVVPIGFVIRAGTNFSFNIGGAVRWKGVYTQPSGFFGLGFMVDIPVIRLGI